MNRSQKICLPPAPVIGITADVTPEKYALSRAYVQMVQECGGTPLILPSLTECLQQYLLICDGFILSGGGDPIMEAFGHSTHPKATPVDPQRQAFELALLDALNGSVGGTAGLPKPALGICLGMQMMGLHAGGMLDQHLPDSLPTASAHWDKREHGISGEFGSGVVHSHHRQALIDAGSLRVIARSDDGVIEAVQRDGGTFYVGVQWHPERTSDEKLGRGVIERLIQAAEAAAAVR